LAGGLGPALVKRRLGPLDGGWSGQPGRRGSVEAAPPTQIQEPPGPASQPFQSQSQSHIPSACLSDLKKPRILRGIPVPWSTTIRPKNHHPDNKVDSKRLLAGDVWPMCDVCPPSLGILPTDWKLDACRSLTGTTSHLHPSEPTVPTYLPTYLPDEGMSSYAAV